MVIHLGERTDGWSQQAMEFALTALEHLGAFARPLGVRLLVENLLNDAATPEHLLQILAIGHLDKVGICLDLGHAHLTVGTADALATFGKRIVSLHVHDNHAVRDEHLWPGEGSIAWPTVVDTVKQLDPAPACVLELSQHLPHLPAELPAQVAKAFKLFD
jgi:sugar phosphate isomerase/epimerase